MYLLSGSPVDLAIGTPDGTCDLLPGAVLVYLLSGLPVDLAIGAFDAGGAPLLDLDDDGDLVACDPCCCCCCLYLLSGLPVDLAIGTDGGATAHLGGVGGA